jgi:DNA primase
MMDGKECIKNANVAFINKSKKDYMVIKKIFPTTCAVQNEGVACFSQENIKFLRDNSKQQILSFDSDNAGVTSSQQITKMFGFGYCNVPKKYLAEGIKDWADLAKKYGMGVLEDYLKQKNML